MKALGMIALLCGACTASVGGTPHDNSDGGFRGGGDDGGDEIDATPDAMPDANLCPSGRQVYLDFAGVALTKSTDSDATMNYVSWSSHNNANIPMWRQGDGNRDNEILDVTTDVQTALTPYHITVVTDRPTAGPYVMIAFGGGSGDAGTNWGIAANKLDCNDTVKSDVGWVTDDVTGQNAANWALSTIGYGLGLDGNGDGGDCMDGWGYGQQGSNPCTFNDGANSGGGCGQNQQDEATALMNFCSL
ncbi:MAG TPA: hypothetical protein VGM88_25255 [Kofleriaceae bacterium]|jgi:hypothetical protein